MGARSLRQLAMEILRLLFLWHLMCRLCNAADMSKGAGSTDPEECGQGHAQSEHGACSTCPPCTEDREVSLTCKIIQHRVCVNRTKGFLKIACEEGLELTLRPLDTTWGWKQSEHHVQLCKHTQQHVLKIVKKSHHKHRIKCSKKKASSSRCQNKKETTARQRCPRCPGRAEELRCKSRSRQCTSPGDAYNRTHFILSCTGKQKNRRLLVDVYSPLEPRVSVPRQRAIRNKLQEVLCASLKDYGNRKKISMSRIFANDEAAATETKSLQHTTDAKRTTLSPPTLSTGPTERSTAHSLTTFTESTSLLMAFDERINEEVYLEEQDLSSAYSGALHSAGTYVAVSCIVGVVCISAFTVVVLACRARKKKHECSSVVALSRLNTDFDSREDSTDKKESGASSTSPQVQLGSFKELLTARKCGVEEKIASVTSPLLEHAAFQQTASCTQILEIRLREQNDLNPKMSPGYRNVLENLCKETLQSSSTSHEINAGCDFCLDSGVHLAMTRSRGSSSATSSLSYRHEESPPPQGSTCESQRSSISSLQSTSTGSSVRVPIMLPLDSDWLKKDIEFGAQNLLLTYVSHANTQTDASPGLEKEPAPMFCARWQTCLTLSSSGGSFRIRDSEAELAVPPNAIRKGSYLDIRAATSTNLPCVHRSLQLREEEIIVSPVVEFQAEECFQFDRWVEVTVPHFLPSSCTDGDVTVYHVDRRHDGNFRLIQLPSETVYKTTRINKAVSWTLSDDSGHSTDHGCPDVGFFRLLPDGRLVVKTKCFCGYFCTTCRAEHSQLHLLVFGSHKKLSQDQRNVKIFLYLWDKRITIEDFQRDYLPTTVHGQRHSFLARKTLSIVTDPNFMNSLVILHFHIHYTCASDWRHALRRDIHDQGPIFPVKRQFILGKVLHVKSETPRCEEWLIENISESTPGEVFQGYVDAVNISQHQLSSFSEAVTSGDAESVTVFLDVQLQTPDVWSSQQPDKMWNQNPSAAEDSANQFGGEASSLTERKYPGTPMASGEQEETRSPYERPAQQGNRRTSRFTDPSNPEEKRDRSTYHIPDLDLTAEKIAFCDGPSLPSPVGLSNMMTPSLSGVADLRSVEMYGYTDHPDSQSPWRLGQRTASFPNNESCENADEKAPNDQSASSEEREEQFPTQQWRDEQAAHKCDFNSLLCSKGATNNSVHKASLNKSLHERR